MDTFATRYWIEDRDGRLPYSISISPLDGQRYYNHTAIDAQESNLDVEDQIILGRSQDPDIILRWEVQISGKLYPGLQQDLGSRLQDKRVPLAIRDYVVSFIADRVLRWPTPTGVSVGVRALIEAAEEAPALEKVTIKGGERETGCAVCLEDFSLGIGAAKLPCSHVFHGDCLGRWLQIRRVCPLCSYHLSNVVD